MEQSHDILHKWVEEYTEELIRWAFHKVSDIQQAEDLVQDTFLAAAEKIGSFKGNSSPKTWLFSILNHKIIDFYRKKVRQPVPADTALSGLFDSHGTWKKDRRPHDWGQDTMSLLNDEEFMAVLKECMDALPDQWSTCIKLKYLMSKKGEEICQELGITPTNLWQIVHRARLSLRECIELNWTEN